MKRLALIIAASLLAGCTAGQGVNSAGTVVCSRQARLLACLVLVVAWVGIIVAAWALS